MLLQGMGSVHQQLLRRMPAAWVLLPSLLVLVMMLGSTDGSRPGTLRDPCAGQETLYAQIDRDLATWKDSGITPDMLEAVMAASANHFDW